MLKAGERARRSWTSVTPQRTCSDHLTSAFAPLAGSYRRKVHVEAELKRAAYGEKFPSLLQAAVLVWLLFNLNSRRLKPLLVT